MIGHFSGLSLDSLDSDCGSTGDGGWRTLNSSFVLPSCRWIRAMRRGDPLFVIRKGYGNDEAM
jgi:hypothetical protein